MERRTIVCYLGGIWRRLEQLEPNLRPFSFGGSVERFAEKKKKQQPVYIITHKTAIIRPVDHTGEM